MKKYSPPAAPGAVLKPRRDAGLLILFAAVAALYFARDVLIPFAFALTLTFLLAPVVAQIQRLHVGRVAAALGAVIVSVAVTGAIGWIIANQLADVAGQLPRYRENIHSKIETLNLPATGQFGRAAQSVKDVAEELTTSDARASVTPRNSQTQPAAATPVPVRIVENPASGWKQLRDLGMPFLAPLGRAGIVLIFTMFMLFQREDLRNRLLRLVGLSQLNLMTQALDDAAGRVSRYIVMQFLVNAGLGTLFGVGLYFMGVPYAALWGIVAAILRIVPYVGTLVAAILPIALSLAVFDGWQRPLLVFALIAILEVVVANFVEPWLYGSHVGISSLALLVSAIFWTVLWGPAGLILSTPLTVCVVVMGRYVPQLSFLHVVLGDEPVLATEAQVYQRLLAMDQAEVHAIAVQFLKEKPLVEFYDAVLIPALAMAEQDRHKGAIDAAREEFLFLSINEMVAEFSEFQAGEGRQRDDAAREEAAAPAAPPLPQQDEGRVFCLPAHDQADEIIAAMLAQLLEQKSFVTVSFPIEGSVPKEWLSLMAAGKNDVVCISSLPPYAFAPARAMCRQIRERFPEIKIVVGVWEFSGDMEKAKTRFERTPPDRISTSLAEAVAHVHELIRPLLVTPPPFSEPSEQPRGQST